MKTGSLQAQGVNNSANQPEKYFQEVLKVKMPAKGLLGMGLIFLPQYQYEAILCMEVLTKYIRQEGLELIGYRDVAVELSAPDDQMTSDGSYITQVFIKADMGKKEFEKKLRKIRNQAEHQIHESKLKHRQAFSMGVLSARMIN